MQLLGDLAGSSSARPIGSCTAWMLPCLAVAGGETLLERSTPRRRTPFSCSDTGGILEWDPRPDPWQAYVCEVAGCNLTQAEWDELFTGDAYRVTCPESPPASEVACRPLGTVAPHEMRSLLGELGGSRR